MLVSRFVHGKSLRNTKTDPINARNVAQYLMTVKYKPYPPSFYFVKLKILAKNTIGCTTGFLLQEMSILLELTRSWMPVSADDKMQENAEEKM